MAIQHVSYDFTRLPEGEIDGFTGGVLAKLYGNAAFPTPPITKPALTAALKTLNDAIAAMADGGPSATALKDQALEQVIDLLRTLAGYVDANQHNDLAVLLSSGFNAASTNRAQTPLPPAQITKISHAGPGRLLVESAVMDNVKSWEARWKPELAPDTAYVHAKNLGATRKMTLTDLPVLTRIAIQTRGVGGSTGSANGATRSRMR